MLAGILLTGGESRRLGVDKARVTLDGETFAVHAATVLASVCEPCIEVGSGASPLPCIRESPPGGGPLAALVAGVRHLATGHDQRVMLLACDMPRVSGELLRCIAERPSASAIPVARGRAQYGCAKYGDAVLDAMCREYDGGARSFRWLHGGALHDEIEWIDEAVWSAVAHPMAFRDVDTPDDARAVGIDIDIIANS